MASARAPTRSAMESAVLAPPSIASGTSSSHTTPSSLISASRNMRSAAMPCGGTMASATLRNRDRRATARFTTAVGGIRVGRC